MKSDLRQLRNFVVLAETASFSHAANRVGLSQPALSRSIAALEARAGGQLFDRTATGVFPTSLGEALLTRAREVVDAAQMFDADLARRSTGRTGRIAMGAGPLVAALAFPTVLPELIRDFPEVTITTRIGPSHDLIRDLRDRRLEFAIFTSSHAPSGGEYLSSPMGQVRMAFMVRPGHPLAGRADLVQGDLAAFPILTGTPSDKDEMVLSSEVLNTVQCDSYHLLKAFALVSDGICIGSPDFAAVGPEPLVPLDVETDWGHSYDLVCLRMANRTPSLSAIDAMARFARFFGVEPPVPPPPSGHAIW